MKINPKVTVLLSVYNGEKYLKEAMESILNQTFRDFEFLIINDCSTDKTLEIIKSYKDERIILVNNEKNFGLQKNLQNGVKMANGDYIARMDADDISLPYRLDIQIDFMDKHPDIGICGGWVKTLGKKKDFIGKYYSNPQDVKASLLFNTSLAHPTVMIRKKHFTKYNLNYDQDYKESEDYELWTRCVDHFPIANIAKILLYYRYHEESKSQKGQIELKNNSSMIKARQLQKIGVSPNEKDLFLHQQLTPVISEDGKEFLTKVENWLFKIIDANKISGYCDKNALKKVIADRWLFICRNNSRLGVYIIVKCLRSPLSNGLDIKNNLNSLLKLMVTSALRIK